MLLSLKTVEQLAASLAIVIITTANADIINVPHDQPTIQAGIDAAKGGDEVTVSAGTYVENINLLGKAITLRSLSGAEVTILDGGNVRSVIRCESGESPETVIQGFTITNGRGEELKDMNSGGGIFILDSSPTMVDCIIVDNGLSSAGSNPGRGGGLYSNGGSATIVGCLITGNNGGGISGSRGGGAYIGSGTTLIDCVVSGNFMGNNSGAIAGGIYCSDGSIINCVIRFNQAQANGVGIGVRFAGGFMSGTSVCSNWTLDDIDVDVWGQFQDGGGNVILESCETDTGACCIDGDCVTTTEGDCLAAGGIYEGNATTCLETECAITCIADFDGDGFIGTSDLLILLASWGICP